MNTHLILLDLLTIIIATSFFAWGHYTGWHDYAEKLRHAGRKPPTRPGWRWLHALLAVAVAGLLLRWVGVLA